MNETSSQGPGRGQAQVLRAVRQRSGPDQAPRGFRYTVMLLDDATGKRLGHCHVCGQLLHTSQIIETTDGQHWQLRPNRKIMPAYWTLIDPAGTPVLVMDQRIFGKLASPLTKIGMTIKRPDGELIYRVVQPDASLPERLLGPDPRAWRIEQDGEPVALIAMLSKSNLPASGWRARLGRFVRGTDTGLVSLGEQHIFDAPQALSILMIFRELRDISHSAE